jgi:hypothetical protein
MRVYHLAKPSWNRVKQNFGKHFFVGLFFFEPAIYLPVPQIKTKIISQ